MIGFDVAINGEKISAAVDNGGLTLLITRLNTESQQYVAVDLTGLDRDTQKQLRWLAREDLKEGDVINVTIKNIQAISTPNTIQDPIKKPDNESRLKRFNEMKEQLEREGLL